MKKTEDKVVKETKSTTKKSSLKIVKEENTIAIDVSTEKINPVLDEVINNTITVGDIIGRSFEINGKEERQVGLIDVFRQLRMIPDENVGGKFAYFTKRNLDYLISTWTFIQKSNKDIFVSKYSAEEHQEYRNTFSELDKDMQIAEQNAKDKWMRDGIIVDEEKFVNELQDYRKEIEVRLEPFKHIIQENTLRETAFDKLLSVEVELKKHNIDSFYIPKGITGYQLDRIFSYINNVE